MFWSAQVKVVLKAKRVWRVVCEAGAACLTSHRVEMAIFETGAGDITEEELVRDLAWPFILQRHGEIPFLCVMAQQDDPQKMWELLLQRYSACATIRQATVHLSLAQTPHTGQAM